MSARPQPTHEVESLIVQTIIRGRVFTMDVIDPATVGPWLLGLIAKHHVGRSSDATHLQVEVRVVWEPTVLDEFGNPQ